MVESRFPTGGDKAPGTEPPKEAYTFTASNKTDHEKDVDIDHNSLHHTIGRGPMQVAAGDHKHGVGDISGAVLDHGALSGLSDDDHPQYPLTNGTRATGTWPIGISGSAAYIGNTPAASSPRVWTYDPGAAALKHGDILLW